MKPTPQTKFGTKVGNADTGNCFAATIASILEVDLETVPNFCEHEDWRERTNKYLADFGLFYIDLQIGEQDPSEIFHYAGYHVISGVGPRGCRHSVVGFKGITIFDPHPSLEGLITHEEYGFLIPVDPRIR